MGLLRAARPLVNQVRRVGEMQSVVQPTPKVAQTREELRRHFPKLVAKQEHHMKMLKQGVPVHESGASDSVINGVLYIAVPVTLTYGFYEMFKFARK